MQKIMFNDRYGLTEAVLAGRKTMTRRLVPENLVKYIKGHLPGIAVMESRYMVGEVVAVAQSYHAIYDEMMCGSFGEGYGDGIYDAFRNAMVAGEAGWDNKMFVKAELMPHRIRITNVSVKRLQDISDEDCLREGVMETQQNGIYFVPGIYRPYHNDGVCRVFKYPRDAFSALIDRVSGKGTWGNNPWDFAYEFELVK